MEEVHWILNQEDILAQNLLEIYDLNYGYRSPLLNRLFIIDDLKRIEIILRISAIS